MLDNISDDNLRKIILIITLSVALILGIPLIVMNYIKLVALFNENITW